ncbi:hypothetical protein QZH41_005873 [Actinostola sp. cb2023]|nr:hypothetical protein QZH41_005873 [Actinostola sp. cb2023]
MKSLVLLTLILVFGCLTAAGEETLNSGEVCSLPKDPGTCFSLTYRYYYNQQTAKCEQFDYGGCQGNANNFETLEECQNKCAGPAL